MLKVEQSVRHGKLRWYETVNCSNCGLRSEADGLGFPPQSIRLKLIEKAGLWRVMMGASVSPPTLAKTIRDALALEPAESLRIAKSLPGAVYAGTEYEARWLAALLAESGELAQVERVTNFQ